MTRLDWIRAVLAAPLLALFGAIAPKSARSEKGVYDQLDFGTREGDEDVYLWRVSNSRTGEISEWVEAVQRGEYTPEEAHLVIDGYSRSRAGGRA